MSLRRQIRWVLLIVGSMMLLLLAESIVQLNQIGSVIERREHNDVPHDAALTFRYHVARVPQFATDASATGDAASLKEAATHFGLANQPLDSIVKSLPEQASQVISALGEESKRITAIVDTIRDIADQTNLLALNAAIEAARAGGQGRGFAVVADEVRKLAERTTQSTQEISGMVEAINLRAADAVKRMDHSLTLVEQGVAQAEHAYQSMTQAGTNTEKVVVEINEINATLQEQRGASAQIAQHVEQIAQMAERNVVSIACIAGHVGNLEQLARNLEDQMQHFRV